MACFRICRSPVLLVGIAILAGALMPGSAAQSFVRVVSIALDFGNARLAFSNDGRVLHAIGASPDPSETQHVRAVTYDATTGAVLHSVNLEPDTTVQSTTSDGRTAIFAKGLGGPGEHIELFLVDTETGKTEPIPSAWYDSKDTDASAELSGDGRLISIYSESGTDDRPMAVSVYTWPGKTFVARQTSEYISAGGGYGGGVTPDGHAIEFENNRVGTRLVDLKTGREMAWFGRDSVRSPNGDWVVQLPDKTFEDESTAREVLIKDGASGKKLGKIDVPVPDDIAYGQMTGAFCGGAGRFILASGYGVAGYAIPSGALVASFPPDTWSDPAALDHNYVSVACSPTAGRVAILSGTRLTLHAMK